MGSEVATSHLGDFVAHQKGFAFKSSDYRANGHPIVRVSNFTDRSIDMTDCSYLHPDAVSQYEAYKLRRCDAVIATVGSWPNNPASVVGKTICVPDKAEGALLNQNAVRLRAKAGLDQRFLFYLLKHLDFQTYIVGTAQGSASQASITLSDIFGFEFPRPPLPEQKAIASILGALDDKIELNRRMNATLEAMARALLQSWFVDFETVRARLDGRKPVGMDAETAALFPDSFQSSELGHIPTGWATGSILRQAALLSGGTPETDVAAYWNGDLPWASAKDVSQCGEAFLIRTERAITARGLEESSTKLIPEFATVVVSRGATTGRLTMFAHTMAMNQTCYGLHSKLDAPFALYCNARHFIDRLVQGGHGSVFDTITTSTFEATPVLLAPKDILQRFDEQVSPLFCQIRASLRNALLPKLLSGELRVPRGEEAAHD
jgi:type I restriction enzyme S subunit